MNLPMILGLVFTSLLAGGLITYFGYYTPFTIASSVLMAVGAGLLTTLEVDSGHAKWIGYQVLYGMGVGAGMQQPLIAVQAGLPDVDVPVGTAMIMFSQMLGGALFISVAQNVFTNKLRENIVALVPSIDPAIIINTGATQLKSAINNIDSGLLPAVLTAYNKSLTSTFYVTVATGALSIFGAVLMPWLSVKGVKPTASSAA